MDKRNVRQRIINLAIKQIRTVGYQSISLRKLMSKLHLTTGAFYKHFRNKSELFYAVFDQISTQIYINIYDQVGGLVDSNPKKALYGVAKILLDYFVNEPYLVDFFLYNSQIKNGHDFLKGGQAVVNIFDLIRLILKNLIEQYQLAVTIEELYVQAWAFLNGYGMLLRNGIITVEDQLIKKTITMLIKGQKSHPE